MELKYKTVLIVEDDIGLLQPLSEQLAAAGIKVLQAQDGEAGLASALSSHPDLILADIVMPKMNGLVMLEKLRQDPWGKKAEVIMLTNFSNVDNVSQAVNEQVFDYIVKSDWSLAKVVEKVKNKLSAI